MPGKGVTVAQRNKAIRQEALREQLAEQCRLQHVLENIAKFEDLDQDIDSLGFQRLKAANEQRIKLLGKYLPDLKAVEISTDEEGITIITKVQREVVNPDNPNG